MRDSRPFGCDGLEARKLLSTVAHPAAQVAPVALNLDGKLVVDMNAASQSTDDFGDVTTSVPVSGVLGAMGKVHGVWNQTDDPYGDYLGPDTIQFSNAHGTYTIAFDSANLKNAHKTGHTSVYPPLGQHFDGGTGTYAKGSEIGSIQVILNPSKSVAETMTLVTAPPGTVG